MRQAVGGVLQKEGPGQNGIRNPSWSDGRCPVQCAAKGWREAVRAVQELEVRPARYRLFPQEHRQGGKRRGSGQGPEADPLHTGRVRPGRGIPESRPDTESAGRAAD
eukprot:TRINITY_DN3229_c0_g2_i2.p4 TRINITY_DN3229_c0_g2~~TRINITY_DN3229_c0_g2_i2.p4  ORF type:complete len:107 (-),score=23.50 TRINITY_DN3229_c0_g2_i2:212-532(-)